MKILILEDEQYRRDMFAEKLADHDLTFALDAPTAIERLSGERFDAIFLDHDLGPNAGDGQDVARHIAGNVPLAPLVWIHSFNPSGAAAMSAILTEGGVRSVQRPFGPGILETFLLWVERG
jgi:CheY-like chemotaxis protein